MRNYIKSDNYVIINNCWMLHNASDYKGGFFIVVGISIIKWQWRTYDCDSKGGKSLWKWQGPNSVWLYRRCDCIGCDYRGGRLYIDIFIHTIMVQGTYSHKKCRSVRNFQMSIFTWYYQILKFYWLTYTVYMKFGDIYRR